MNADTILITEKDFTRIKHILSYQNSEEFENLDQELDRAKIIATDEVPANLVTMNSRVKFLNIQDNKEMVVTLVYPTEANFSEGKISVLASLGSALIGLQTGQEINWKFPDNKVRTLKILEVFNEERDDHD